MTALKKQILKRGIKQKFLAERIGISPAAVSLQIKNGIRVAATAERYARVINCSPRILIDFNI